MIRVGPRLEPALLELLGPQEMLLTLRDTEAFWLGADDKARPSQSPQPFGNSDFVGHLVPCQSPDPSVGISDPFLSCSNAGCPLHGGSHCVHRRTPSKHRPGASGRRSAAVEAAGAGAAEDSLRSPQDAQLDGCHGCTRDPGHGYQLLGLIAVFPGASLQMPMAFVLLPL